MPLKMNKRALFLPFLLLLVLITTFGFRQLYDNPSIFVSIEGGTKLLDSDNQVGYNHYRYFHHYYKTDSLILSGNGYETGLVPSEAGGFAEYFNAGIIKVRAELPYVKPHQSVDTLEHKGKKLIVDYLNVDTEGGVQFTLTLL
jgi:hypothetical protein